MKKTVAAVLLVLNISLLTGCWGMREINELGLVMAVGIDREAGSSDYIMTVQIANPSSSAGEKSEGTSKRVWIGTARGKTLFEAARALSQISSKRIMWAHNNIIIIGEALAKDGILPVIDFFSHNPELRMKTFVVVARGDAKQYLASTSGLEDITGLGLREMYRYQLLAAKSVQSSLLRINRSYFSDDRQMVIAGVSFRQEVVKPGTDSGAHEATVIVLGGAAVFKDDKMVGWLSPDETRGLAWLRNENASTIVTVTVPGYGDKGVSVETDKVKAKIATEVIDGIPAVTVSLTGHGRVVEEDVATNLSIGEFKDVIKKAVDEEIEAEFRLALAKVQKDYKTDILNFGASVHAQHKNEWNQIKDRWSDLFPDVPVTIVVNIKIESSTTHQQPLKEMRKWVSNES